PDANGVLPEAPATIQGPVSILIFAYVKNPVAVPILARKTAQLPSHTTEENELWPQLERRIQRHMREGVIIEQQIGIVQRFQEHHILSLHHQDASPMRGMVPRPIHPGTASPEARG